MPRREGGYFVFTRSEDGDVSCEQLTEEDLVSRLNERYYGEVEFVEEPDGDPQSDWGGENVMLIIRGELVIPTAAEKAVRWKLSEDE